MLGHLLWGAKLQASFGPSRAEGRVPSERVAWPTWWEWELELTSHVQRRMEDREFTEVELRRMLEVATAYRNDPLIEGRFVVETRHRGEDWEIIVEPDADDHWLVVVTAYPL